MALYKQAEYARKCGINDAYLTTMKKRGKVVVNDEGMVDDADPVNQIFESRQAELAAKRALKKKEEPVVEGSAPTEAVVTTKAKPAKAEKAAKPKPDAKAAAAALNKLNLEADKKSIDIQKTELEVNLLKMQQDKMAGRLIPTDMVKGLFNHHFKSVTVSFKQAIDQIATEFGKRGRMNRNEMAELKGEMIKMLNRSVEDAISMSKRDVGNLVLEYSQVKKLR